MSTSPHDSFLGYKRLRFLKLGVLLVAVAIAAYVWDDPVAGRRGDTPVGYALGIVAAALMLWLTWFGVRKRSYRSTGAPLRGWLSAHVYLGATVPILAALHCAFHFGPNVHTLAYLLMLATVLTGLVGLVYYRTVPQEMAENRPGEKLESLFERLASIDAESKNLVRELPDVFARAVALSVEETYVGGGLVRQLRGTDPRCGTSRALAAIEGAQLGVVDAQRETVKELLGILAVKRSVLRRIRQDLRFKALLQLWLVVHVPLAIAALAALAAHVVIVLYM
jgi:hypothetical protein